jgi:hypothetical protein
MANAKNMTYRNGTNLYECYAAAVITVVAWNILFVGLIANFVLFYLVLKKLESGRRSDKLHLLNIIVANLFSLFGSLLGEILARGNIIPSAQTYCLFYHQVYFISLFNYLTSMAALCYILYENIVKFPANRLFSFSLSLKITAASWILSLVLVPAGISGFFVAEKEGVGRICKTNIDQTPTFEETASFFSLIVLVTIWISVCATIIRISLTGVASKLKQHREQTQELRVHNNSVVKVVSFNKQAYVMVFCYSICWIPFGIAAALTAANVIVFHCVYFTCLVGAHFIAASTPLIYLTIDKRFRVRCCSNQKPRPRQIRVS